MKNYLKRVLVVMMVLLPCFQTQVFASSSDDPDNIPVKPVPDNGTGPNDPNPGGPRSRARGRYIEVSPTCTYFEGEVTIQADSSITFINASVERLEDNAVWTDAGMGDTLIMSVTDEPGTYILTFTLSNGKSYIGEYTLY